jgi:hypothetical protein
MLFSLATVTYAPAISEAVTRMQLESPPPVTMSAEFLDTSRRKPQGILGQVDTRRAKAIQIGTLGDRQRHSRDKELISPAAKSSNCY